MTTKDEATTAEADAPELVTLSIRVPRALAERVRDAVYWTPGATLVRLGEAALTREVERLERQHGGRFRPRQQRELKRGRRSA